MSEEEFDRWGEPSQERLSKVMSINGYDQAESSLLRHIRVVANLQCDTHTNTRFCQCADAMNMSIRQETKLKQVLLTLWESDIADNDAALLYTGPEATVALQQANDGHPPEVFVSSLMSTLPKLRHYEISNEQQFIPSFLAWWAHVVNVHRAASSTRREIRTKLRENLPRMPRSTGEGTLEMNPDPHRNAGGDPLCSYIRFHGSKGKGHMHTLVVYAKSSEDGKVVYEVLREQPRHEECEFDDPGEEGLEELVRPFVRVDLARAGAVVREW
ncbi:hypothetical protein EJ03DRAFT_124711 [Teratosphaeria nubilosa]|uniref:Uncharacterized protein n=1 Tax=Teratosphaeria nubilosa TaxID=161662 RepID=A0A6G1LK68_9PEZI|nr:hypothetical protein EJ03DRAFT_124711 [Teratosphaeria nubilosa]